MNFGMIILNQNIKAMQNYVIWILSALLFRLRQKTSAKIFYEMLKKWFDTSKYSKGDKRPLPIGMNKKKNRCLRMS